MSGDFPFPRPITETQAKYLRDQYQASIAEFWRAWSRFHLPDTRHPSPQPNIVSDEKAQP